MANGKNCPNCGKDIGFWTVLKAKHPSLITCSHCQAKLNYNDTNLIRILHIIVVALIGIPSAVFIIVFMFSGNYLIAFLVLPALIIALIFKEVLFSIYVRSYKQLVLRDSDNGDVDLTSNGTGD